MSVRGEDEEREENVRNEAGEFKMRNVEEKREKFSIANIFESACKVRCTWWTHRCNHL